MTNPGKPKSAPDWAKFLLDQPLPSPFQIGKRVLRSMQRTEFAYSKIAEQINCDPVLSYYVMAAANSRRAKRNQSSQTLDHSISLIGVDQLQKVVSTLPYQSAPAKGRSAIDHPSLGRPFFYYLKTLSTSLYAAHLGRAICVRKDLGDPESIYWSSLFLGIPLWYLWRFATTEMCLIQAAMRTKFAFPADAEREVLGTSIYDLASELIKSLALPLRVQQCFDPSHQLSLRQWVKLAQLATAQGQSKRVEQRDLLLRMQAPSFIVMLANLVAQQASHDWYSRACLRTQRMLAAYLQLPLSEAITLTHEAAARMSRSHPLPEVLLPAASLFFEPKTHLTARQTQATAATPPSTALASTSTSTPLSPNAEKQTMQPPAKPTENTANSALFSELTEIMLNRPEEFVDLHELMNAATKGIAYGIGLKRTAVSLINKDRSRIKTYYQIGSQPQSELARFETQLIAGTLFAKLMERPASVWIKPTSSNSLSALVPLNFKQIIGVDDYFLMSVFVGKRPVAIFYADNGRQEQPHPNHKSSKPLNEKHYAQFKAMCAAVTTALLYQASNKKSLE